MIVVDASAMVEALVGRDPDPAILDALTREVSAPHVLDTEVLSALRGLCLGGRLTPQAAEIALDRYFALTIIRHETSPLAARVWQLRHQFTSYDASYLALAEALGVQLYTCDAKLATSGHRAVVHVMGRSNS